MSYLSDIEIAQAHTMRPITDIAAQCGIDQSYLELYGRYKAKIDLSLLQNTHRKGKLILVTAMTPTPAGEGKTTTTVGLADGLRKIGKNAVIALREPSLGPVFGIKGGAAGGCHIRRMQRAKQNFHRLFSHRLSRFLRKFHFFEFRQKTQNKIAAGLQHFFAPLDGVVFWVIRPIPAAGRNIAKQTWHHHRHTVQLHFRHARAAQRIGHVLRLQRDVVLHMNIAGIDGQHGRRLLPTAMSPFPLGVQLSRDLPPVDDGRNRAPAIEFNPDMLQNRLISAVTV